MMGALTGCTQPPLDQLKAAKKAIQSARAAGASEYARDDHAALEQDFVLAKNELIRPGNVFLPFQSFSDAEKLLVKVAEDAEHVAANAAQNKEMAKAAALAMEPQTKQVLASAKKFMSHRPIRMARTSRNILEQEFTALEKSLHVVGQLMKHGDYLDAEKQARILRGKGLEVSEQIQQRSPKISSAVDQVRQRL